MNGGPCADARHRQWYMLAPRGHPAAGFAASDISRESLVAGDSMNMRRLTLTVILAGFAVAAAAPSAGAEDQSAPKLPPELVAKNCYTVVDASFSRINWQSYIHIKSYADVQASRAALIKQYWPDGLPS